MCLSNDIITSNEQVDSVIGADRSARQGETSARVPSVASGQSLVIILIQEAAFPDSASSQAEAEAELSSPAVL